MPASAKAIPGIGVPGGVNPRGAVGTPDGDTIFARYEIRKYFPDMRSIRMIWAKITKYSQKVVEIPCSDG